MPPSPSSNRKRRFAPQAIALSLLALMTACSNSQPPPAPPPQPYPQQPPPGQYPPQQAPPAPQPPITSAMLDMLIAAQKSIPCPLPGLPPEIARLIDCAAIRTASSAVAYVPRAITGALPMQVDHRAQGLTGPVKDQNPVGACAGFAISSVMDNAIRRRGRFDVVSPLHVFSGYTQQNDLGALKGKPLTVEPVWPFDKVKACRIAAPQHGGYCESEVGVYPGSGVNDPVLLSERARADSMGAYRVDALEYMTAEHVDQIALLLAEGEAVWVALAFNRQAWDWDSVKSGYLPYYPPQDGLGHAVVLQGYRMGPTGREFLFQNSWGPKWGLGGYLFIPESMLRSHLLHAYRVRVSDAAGAPYIPPSMPGTPAVPTASCPAGQTSVLGVCLPIPGAPQGTPVPAPSTLPSPGGLPPIANCPAGTLPNPLSPSQCVAVPSGF